MSKLQKVVLDKLIARTCRDSYFTFLLEFWSTVIPEKIKLNWHIRETCDQLQQIAERVFADQPKEFDFIANFPPGTSKSSLFSIFFQPWVWTRFPQARFITGSYAERLALDLSRKSRDVVLCDKYKRLFPEITLREDQNTKGFFANTQGGFRYAVGVGGSVIGMHAHFIVVDDPIDPQGVLSDSLIRESNTWMTETLSRRKVDLQLTPMILVMQRLHQNDPTGDWLDRGGRILHWCLPCDTSWEIKPAGFEKFYQEGLFDPVRLPASVLDEALKTLLEVGYAGQYGQQPVPRGGALFKVDMFRVEDDVPLPKGDGWRTLRKGIRSLWKRGPVRYWDKAATQSGGSWTVGLKMAMDSLDRIWILDVKRFQLSSGAREQAILVTAKADGKECRIGIEQEPGGGGKEAAENAARRYSMAGYKVTIDVVRGTKEERAGATNEIRADNFSVQVNTGNVILLKGQWNKPFIEEYRFFPNSKTKDQVDAGSGAYGMISKSRLRIGALPQT